MATIVNRPHIYCHLHQWLKKSMTAFVPSCDVPLIFDLYLTRYIFMKQFLDKFMWINQVKILNAQIYLYAVSREFWGHREHLPSQMHLQCFVCQFLILGKGQKVIKAYVNKFYQNASMHTNDMG